MSIYKIESGLIFDDQFQEIHPRWIASPSGAFSLSEKGLSMAHSKADNGTNLLFETPDEKNLVFQVEADYTPTQPGDEGGIVVWNSALNKMEFLESVEMGRQDEYPSWQTRKRNNLWSFFAQRSGEWELFDAIPITETPSMLGVTLKGQPNELYKPLNIRRAILCRGTSIVIGNVNSGYRVELLDDTGSVVEAQTIPNQFAGTNIELPTIPFRGRIRIYDVPEENYPQGRLISEQVASVDFYGGDIYLYGTDLLIEWQGEELNKDTITHLGTMQNNTILTSMTVRNVTSGNIAENVELSIKQYQEEFGWEWVDIALDLNGSPGEWKDVLQLGTLNPGDSINIWVFVQKNEVNWATRPTHFIFDLNHQ